MEINQNFSVPAGSDETATFTIDNAVGFDLTNATVKWKLFEESNAVPTPGVDPLLEKDNMTIDGGVTLIESPPSFLVDLLAADTVALLRNYYHEAVIVSEDGLNSAVACGIMTVTQTEVR